jgi:hypothetical protein
MRINIDRESKEDLGLRALFEKAEPVNEGKNCELLKDLQFVAMNCQVISYQITSHR